MGRPFSAVPGLAQHRRVAPAEIDLAYVAELLRRRRRALQPEDVGLPRGRRRRTPGLRRDEVASLCSVSIAYYSQLERRRFERDCGPRPSQTMLAGIARGLRLTRSERDRLFSAAGYEQAEHKWGSGHVEPGLMHVLDRIADTPALALDSVGQVLHQTAPATSLFGDLIFSTGWARSSYYRWFTYASERRFFTAGEQATIGTEIAADLRRSLERDTTDGAAGDLVRILLDRSSEFTDIWLGSASSDRLVTTRRSRVLHPEVGVIDLYREVLLDATSCQRLVIYLATPGTESYGRLRLASVIGHQRF